MPPEQSFPSDYLFKEVGPRQAAAKRRAGLCKHYGCRNKSRQGAGDCETCKSRKARLKSPVRYAYNNVKRSADMREIPFELTFDQFKEFDRQTGYVESKGRDVESLTIDRIDPEKGYEAGNIRALTFSQNSSRQIDGMTDPAEPIAAALAAAAGGVKTRYAYMKQATKLLLQVEMLQAQQEGGYSNPEEDCPF